MNAICKLFGATGGSPPNPNGDTNTPPPSATPQAPPIIPPTNTDAPATNTPQTAEEIRARRLARFQQQQPPTSALQPSSPYSVSTSPSPSPTHQTPNGDHGMTCGASPSQMSPLPQSLSAAAPRTPSPPSSPSSSSSLSNIRSTPQQPTKSTSPTSPSSTSTSTTPPSTTGLRADNDVEMTEADILARLNFLSSLERRANPTVAPAAHVNANSNVTATTCQTQTGGLEVHRQPAMPEKKIPRTYEDSPATGATVRTQPPPAKCTSPPARSNTPPNSTGGASGGSSIPWDDLLVARVMRVSLRPLPPSNGIDNFSQVLVLDNVAYPDGGYTREILDTIVVEWISGFHHKQTPFSYILGCFERAFIDKKLSFTITKVPQAKQQNYLLILTTITDLLCSYIATLLSNPDLFENPDFIEIPRGQQIVDLFLNNSTELPNHLLQMLITKFPTQESLNSIFAPIFEALYTTMCTTTINSPKFLPPIQILAQLTCSSSLVNVMTGLPRWIPSKTPLTGTILEKESFLGPFFSVSMFSANEDQLKQFFPYPLNGRSGPSMDTIRSCASHIISVLWDVVKNILKVNKEPLLNWFAAVLTANTARTKINVPEDVSSDGLMMNLSGVLLCLVEPLMDTERAFFFDPYYVTHGKRIDFSNETKLAASQSEVANWVDPRNASRQAHYEQSLKTIQPLQVIEETSTEEVPKSFKPTTEYFFLTLRSMQLGFLSTWFSHKKLASGIGDHKSLMNSMAETRSTWNMTPEGSLREQELMRVTDLVERGTRRLFSENAQLTESDFVVRSIRFFNLVAHWMLSIVAPGGPCVPLPISVPMKFAALPEFFIEAMFEYLKFLLQAAYNTVGQISWSKSSIIDSLVCFLGSPNYIRNPYLRSKFVQVLGELTQTKIQFGGSKSVADIVFSENVLAKNFLVKSLLKFYVDIEFTGTHTQFYDKFNWRFDVQIILAYLWGIPHFKASIIQETQRETELMSKFAQYVVNDTNFLLDEALSKLSVVQSLRDQMQDRAEWLSLEPGVRRDKEGELRHTEDLVRHYFTQSNSSVHMLHFMSKSIIEPFVGNIVVDGVASMLNYFLVTLIGPNALSLNISDPERYNFNPKLLLDRIVDVYISLGVHPNFPKAMGTDTRSYTPDAFESALEYLRQNRLKSTDDLEKFQQLISKAQQHYLQEQGKESLLGEIPDEFQDPLTFTLMWNPVILPTSKTTVDRAVITRHLLSDSTDPFNREPLTIDQVIPNTELKKKIDAFVEERLRASRTQPNNP
ncbi:Ubiquitin conjugation factor E4, core [Pelomyxa schiedti]|nr:Ubiquitin conjugation factor E4, core [Pelomyxa schiedti]